MHLQQGTDLDPLNIEALSGYKDFLLQWGFLKADFDVNDWIDPNPLQQLLAGEAKKAA